VQICNESDIKFGELYQSLITGAQNGHKSLPMFKGIVMLANQKAYKGELKLCKHFINSKRKIQKNWWLNQLKRTSIHYSLKDINLAPVIEKRKGQ
jgi:hypothetical protein